MFDEQREKWGNVKKAVEETIRICKDEGVLKDYLTSREKEVVEIMNILFDQEYAMERRMMSREIASFVEASQIFGASKEATIREVAKKYKHLLEQGNNIDAQENYLQFRGKPADEKYLLIRKGLL